MPASMKNTSRYYSTTNQYPDDESIPSQYRFESDPFWRSGYDHGHICPSADRLASADANYQTFFMSNMQTAGEWIQCGRVGQYGKPVAYLEPQ